METISLLEDILIRRQTPSGGWSFFGSSQVSVEATCLALLAVGSLTPESGSHRLDWLLGRQQRDGSWPAFLGDRESSWTTALALSVLNVMSDVVPARERAFQWLLKEHGREANWLWQWKFRIADRNVRFNPAMYGWPWSVGAASWVIPTAFSLVAIKQFTACKRVVDAEKRIQLGVGMLLDRACPGGGWNSGNNVVYGVPLRPHVEATAIALLALQDEEPVSAVGAGLAWLKKSARTTRSAESLAWSILTLFLYQEPIEDLKSSLAMIVGEGTGVPNNSTLATSLLALKCGRMIHPFAVLR